MLRAQDSANPETPVCPLFMAEPGADDPTVNRARASDDAQRSSPYPAGTHMSQAPPAHDRLQLTDTPNAVRLARLHTAAVLSQWGVPSDTIETATLVVSELTTNVVRHSQEAAGGESLFSQNNAVQTVMCARRRRRAYPPTPAPARRAHRWPIRT